MEKLAQQIDISHYMIDPDSLNLVVPGDLITSEEGFINGHGTYKENNRIMAAVIGTVEITNKLIIVNPLRSTYAPQIGDIVVGRVHEIANKKWKVDIRAAAYAYLPLNSTYIPEQRKKNQEDEFNMRRIMEEGDLIVAEVHSVNHDKTYNLHTRNPKYGRLEPGTLIEAWHRQVKRQKHHLITIASVGIVLGNNGNLYLSNMRRDQAGSSKEGAVECEPYTQAAIKEVTLLGNILRLLSQQGLQISEVLLRQLFQWAKDVGIEAFAVLGEAEMRDQLLSRVRLRIPKRIEEISSSLRKN